MEKRVLTTQNTKCGIQNTENIKQNTEYRIQNTEYRKQKTENRIKNTEYRIHRINIFFWINNF